MKKRVRAIIIRDKKLLVIERSKNGIIFWTLPGGGVESDDADDLSALKRECLEEVNLAVEVSELIFSKEFNDSMEDFYLCKIIRGEVGPGNGPEYQPGSKKYSGRHSPTWLPIEKLREYDLKPAEMREEIIKNKKFYE